MMFSNIAGSTKLLPINSTEKGLGNASNGFGRRNTRIKLPSPITILYNCIPLPIQQRNPPVSTYIGNLMLVIRAFSQNISKPFDMVTVFSTFLLIDPNYTMFLFYLQSKRRNYDLTRI